MFRFDPERLNTTEELGSSINACVYPYQKYPEDNRYAVKHMFAKDFPTLRKLIQEIVIGFSCDHPSILPMKGYFIEESRPIGWNLYIKMPRMQGTLKDILDKHKKDNDPIPEKDIIRYFHTIACGLEYLHKRKIAHRDVKPANILFGKDGKVVLGDIGVGKFVPDDEALVYVSDIAGTELYRAPEMSAGAPKTLKKDVYKADSWSLGIVIGELCLLHRKERRPNQALEVYLKSQLAQIETKYSKMLAALVGELLHPNMAQRKSVSQIRQALEDHYGNILGLEGANVSKFTLDKVKNELLKNWRTMFDFDISKGFLIKGTDTNKIGDKLMGEFLKDLGVKFTMNNLQTLQNLDINIESCSQVTDVGLNRLAEHIGGSLKELRNLSINLVACFEIQDQGLTALGQQIANNLKSLEELTLDLGWCKKISDQGLKGFQASLTQTNLQSLQCLTLNFRGCSQISDEGIKEFSTHLGSELKSLSHLSLCFWNCVLITDNGLRELGTRALPTLEKLYHLSLNFIGCYEIINGGIEGLALSIMTNQKKLKNVTLSFIGTGVEQEKKEDLKNTLNELLGFIPHRNIAL